MRSIPRSCVIGRYSTFSSLAATSAANSQPSEKEYLRRSTVASLSSSSQGGGLDLYSGSFSAISFGLRLSARIIDHTVTTSKHGFGNFVGPGEPALL